MHIWIPMQAIYWNAIMGSLSQFWRLAYFRYSIYILSWNSDMNYLLEVRPVLPVVCLMFVDIIISILSMWLLESTHSFTICYSSICTLMYPCNSMQDNLIPANVSWSINYGRFSDVSQRWLEYELCMNLCIGWQYQLCKSPLSHGW